MKASSSAVLASALLGLGTLLTACGGDPTPPPPPAEQLGFVLGQLQPWAAGQASSMKASDLNNPASVNPHGQFNLNFPNAAAMNSTYAATQIPARDIFGCSVAEIQVFSAPGGMQITPENYLVSNKNERYITPVNATKTNYNFRGWWYSTVSGTLRFKGNCIITGPVDTTLNLERGWNVINVQTLGSNAGTTYAVSAQPTTRTNWTQAAAAAALSVQGVSPEILTPWKALPQYQNR